MQIIDILRQGQDGLAMENLAAAFGVEPQAADAAVEALVPDIAQRLEQITLSRGGLAELVRALGDPRHRRALSDPSVFVDPAVGEDGGRILGHIFQTPEAARAAAHRAASRAGLDPEVVQRMLPYIAALTMSGLSKALLDGLGSEAGRIPGIEPGPQRPYQPAPRQPAPQPSGGPYPLPEIGGGFETVPMPGSSGGGTGGGNPLPGPLDVGRGPSGGRSASPMPMPYPVPGPGQPGGAGPTPHNPLDDLSDILRRRGTTTTDGSPLWSIVRSILGGILGFQSRGIMGWIIRFLVFKVGWGFLRRVLGRMVMGR